MQPCSRGKALAAHNVALTHELRPGESCDSVLVFDLPADARNPRLLLADWYPVTMLLIGHESSFLHKKTYFQLESGTVANRRCGERPRASAKARPMTRVAASVS